MGVVQNVFIGPYAEFAVPAGRRAEFPPEDEGGDFLFWEDLHCNLGMGDRHEDCYRFTPTGDGPEGQARPMYAWGKGVCLKDQDLTDLDRESEMAWLTSAYAEPLGVLAERFGTPPRIRWGVVFWLS